MTNTYITTINATFDDEGFGHFVMPEHKHPLAPDAGTALVFAPPVLVNHKDGVRFESRIWTVGEDAEDTGMMAVWDVDNPDANEEADMVDRWESVDIYV